MHRYAVCIHMYIWPKWCTWIVMLSHNPYAHLCHFIEVHCVHIYTSNSTLYVATLCHVLYAFCWNYLSSLSCRIIC